MSLSTVTMIGAAVLVIIAWVTYVYFNRRERQWFFTHILIEKNLLFVDPIASTARLSTVMTSRSNYSGITQMWFRNINADGQIKNILLDGKPAARTQKKAGSLEVCKEFDHPLRSGEIVKTELSYELTDSFSGGHEGITHVTATKTESLSMRVKFHAGRLPKQTRAFVEYGSTLQEKLYTLTQSEDKTEALLRVKRPQIGGYYTIEWDW